MDVELLDSVIYGDSDAVCDEDGLDESDALPDIVPDTLELGDTLELEEADGDPEDVMLGEGEQRVLKPRMRMPP